MSRIAILGAGAWGTALAISLARRGGHEIRLWSHSVSVAELILQHGQNLPYLSGFPVSREIAVTANLEFAIRDAEIILCVTPSQHLRGIIEQIAPMLHGRPTIVSASKGIEEGTLLRMSEIIASLSSCPVAVLSGPTFAQEVATGSPSAIVAASSDNSVAQTIQGEFSSSSLRVYTNDDVVGVELGGALKNVIAVASGVVTGLNLGHNSAAALITRGIAEITRLAVACGGKSQTLAGLAGLGDLVLTATGALSRNRTVGIELGRGRQLEEILASMGGKVAEGVRSTASVLGLAEQRGVEMPITAQVDAILHHGKRPSEAIRDLMSRPGRDEQY